MPFDLTWLNDLPRPRDPRIEHKRYIARQGDDMHQMRDGKRPYE